MKLSWKKLVGLVLAVLVLALVGGAALAEVRDAPRGEAGTWMQVYHEEFWRTASTGLTLLDDGTGSMRDGDKALSLRWTAGEDGGVAAVECDDEDYSFDVFGPCIVATRSHSTAMYKYMFDASGARVPEPDYSASEFMGLWTKDSVTNSLALAPNGNGRFRAYYLYDDYEPICWWPLADGSGAQFVRGGVSGVEDMRLVDGELRVGNETFYDKYTLSDEALDVADFQYYSHLSAAPTPEPTSEPPAQLYTNGVYNFYYRDDGIEIIGYTGADADIEIPEAIDNQPVTRIGEQAFFRNETIENVVIPGCVKSIGERAFSECGNLRTVRIEDGTESIGAMAFALCERMDWVRIPASVTWIGAKVQDRDPYTGFNYLIVDHGSYAENYAMTQGGKYSFYTYITPDAADVPAGLDVQPGNVVRFGSTQWLVLKREGGRAMLLRWLVAKRDQFDTDQAGDVWSNASLRDKLVSEFKPTFSDSEWDIIEPTLLFTPNNPNSSIPLDYPPTMNSLFLLSYGEVEELLPDEDARKAYLENGSPVDWWLRTDGTRMDHNMTVGKDGSWSGNYDSNIAGVRPALWVDLTRAQGLIELAAESSQEMYDQTFGTQLEQLSGTWIAHSDEVEEGQTFVLTLNADGTGSYTRSDRPAVPTTIYDSYQFQWTYDEDRVILTHDGVEEELSIREHELVKGDPWRSFEKKPYYEAMMQSAQENTWTTLDALLGAWEVQGAELGGIRFTLKLVLQPDGGMQMTALMEYLADGVVVNERNLNLSGYWRMTANGVYAASGDDSSSSNIYFGDGTITLVEDDLTFPVVRAANLSQWQADSNGGQYVYREYQDYSSTGYTGVWKVSRIVDEYDDIRGDLYLCLARDGTGTIVDVYSGRNIRIEWDPSDGGLRFALASGEADFWELGLFEGSDYDMRKDDGTLIWISSGPSGLLEFVKIEDSYEPGEVYSAAQTSLPTPVFTSEPTPEPMSEPTPVPMPAGDAEGELRAYLTQMIGAREISRFFYADYDGDGAREAFAFIGTVDDSWGYDAYNGDIWFVSTSGAQLVQQGCAYDALETLGTPPTMIFHAEEYYGGSGSVSHTWIVESGAPVEAAAPASGELEWAGGNDYYSYPSAFDMYDDGTGHTWKRYYFFMDGGELREYGGINISLEELLEFDGAEELLQEKIDDGYSIGDIIYRANGVINVNLEWGSENANLTLRYDDTSVSYWEEDGGIYLTASDPSIAVYPAEFRHPTGTGSAPDAEETPAPESTPTAEPAPSGEGAPTGGQPLADGSYACDLDGDGVPETLSLYKGSGVDDRGNDMTEIRLRVLDADGSVRGDGAIYSYFDWSTSEQHYQLYNLGGNRIYVNAKYYAEGISDNFEIFRVEGGALIEEINLRDPDYTDGCGIIDEQTNEDIFFGGNSDKAGPAYMDALNRSFAPFGVSFAPDGRFAIAELPDSQLICDITPQQIEDGNSSVSTGGDYIEDEPIIPEPEPDPNNEPAAYAYITGDVNMRSGPSLSDDSVCIVPSGSEVEYLGESAVDNRGVTWYSISYNGMVGWGSSKYVVLE